MPVLGLLIAVAMIGSIVWLDHRDGEYLNGFGNASSTSFSFWRDDEPEEEPVPEERKESRSSSAGGGSSVSSQEAEKRANEVYKKLEVLEGDVRALELRSPASPYAGMVTMKAGDAKATDPKKEHVLITASPGNASSINITGWRLESYVTKSKATIPLGARLLKTRTSRSEEPILLLPGERAYLTTSETPIRVSFRENECTGYLMEYEDFSPSLKKSCPMPQDELLQASSVKASDSKCAAFVDKISRCEIVDEEAVDDASLSGGCESFINSVLDYEGCVAKHDEDPTFFATGDWRIFLDKDRELWRSTREIIRLLDGEGRVVDVVEY